MHCGIAESCAAGRGRVRVRVRVRIRVRIQDSCTGEESCRADCVPLHKVEKGGSKRERQKRGLGFDIQLPSCDFDGPLGACGGGVRVRVGVGVRVSR